MLFLNAKDGFSHCIGMSYMLHLYFSVLSFVLKQKKEPKKNQGCLFPPTRFLHYAKGQKLASLKQSALLNASFRALA